MTALLRPFLPYLVVLALIAALTLTMRSNAALRTENAAMQARMEAIQTARGIENETSNMDDCALDDLITGGLHGIKGCTVQ